MKKKENQLFAYNSFNLAKKQFQKYCKAIFHFEKYIRSNSEEITEIRINFPFDRRATEWNTGKRVLLPCFSEKFPRTSCVCEKARLTDQYFSPGQNYPDPH